MLVTLSKSAYTNFNNSTYICAVLQRGHIKEKINYEFLPKIDKFGVIEFSKKTIFS